MYVLYSGSVLIQKTITTNDPSLKIPTDLVVHIATMEATPGKIRCILGEEVLFPEYEHSKTYWYTVTVISNHAKFYYIKYKKKKLKKKKSQ